MSLAFYGRSTNFSTDLPLPTQAIASSTNFSTSLLASVLRKPRQRPTGTVLTCGVASYASSTNLPLPSYGKSSTDLGHGGTRKEAVKGSGAEDEGVDPRKGRKAPDQPG
eukprot:3464407-Rhodomonas_salina.2